MAGDYTPWQPNTPVNPEVNNTPLIKEYYSDGTVGVGVDDAYKLHTSDRRKHDARRTLRKLPLILLVLAFMVLTPLAIIKLTSGGDSESKTPASAAKTQKPAAKTPAAKPQTPTDQSPASQNANQQPTPASSSTGASSASAGTTTQPTTKKTVVKRKVVVKKKHVTTTASKTVASTARVGQSVAGARVTSATTTASQPSSNTGSTNHPTTPSKPATPAAKPPKKPIKKPIKKKPQQQIGTSVSKTSNPKPTAPVQKPASKPKPAKPAQKPSAKPKPAAKPKPVPKPSKPTAKPKPAPKDVYVGGPSKFVDFNQQSWGSRIASSGCGPTAAAIVVSSLKDRRVDPRQMADILTPKYYIPGSGTRQEAATFHYIAKRFNLKYAHPKNYAEINQVLRQGGMVIAFAKPGAFTQNGHFIVIRKVSQDGQRYVIADPNANNNTEKKHWTAEELRRGGIADFWGFTPR